MPEIIPYIGLSLSALPRYIPACPFLASRSSTLHPRITKHADEKAKLSSVRVSYHANEVNNLTFSHRLMLGSNNHSPRPSPEEHPSPRLWFSGAEDNKCKES